LKKLRGNRKSLPLSDKQISRYGLGYLASLPWGSIATVRNGGESLALMVGPIKFKDNQGGWHLPVLERADSADELQRDVRKFRDEAGLNPRFSKKRQK